MYAFNQKVFIFALNYYYFRWATFEVTTNGNYPDSVQVRAAGFLEGYLSHELIYLNYLNTLDMNPVWVTRYTVIMSILG